MTCQIQANVNGSVTLHVTISSIALYPQRVHMRFYLVSSGVSVMVGTINSGNSSLILVSPFITPIGC